MVINIQDDILKLHALGLLDDLLIDRTTKRNILWATDAHSDLGSRYERDREITTDLITGENASVIKTRARKSMEQQSERTRRHGEVSTPLWVCKKMIDHIDELWFRRKTGINKTDEQGRIFFKQGRTWRHYVDNRRMEITCGEAPFLATRYDPETGEAIPIPQRIGILDRKLRALSENAQTEEEWMEWALRAVKACYGFEFQGDSLLIGRVNVLMTFEEYLFARWNRKPTPREYETFCHIVTWNLWQMDGLTGMIPYATAEVEQFSLFPVEPKPPPDCRIYNWRQKRSIEFRNMKEANARMKFDFVIGNPPYQDETLGDNKGYAPPIYHQFMDGAYEVADAVELIHPARFLFNAGSTPKAWNKKMLSDPHLKVLYYEPNEKKIFPSAIITGGIAITYHNNNQSFGAIEVFSQFEELNTIRNKVVESKDFSSASAIVSSAYAYHITDLLYDEHPELKGRLSKGHEHDLKSNVFDLMPEVFLDERPTGNYIQILGRKSNSRAFCWIKREYISGPDSLDKYKLFFSKADGAAGTIGKPVPARITGSPTLSLPGSGTTESFLTIGQCATENEANNLMKYYKSKFSRALLGVLKVTQDITPGKWEYVPLQDFTTNSDVNWSRSIPEIDQQLYAKYGLNENEIAFIESHVKEME